ncbi:MAG TPA: HD domain-containing protein [Turneriella sp.]|nr:HD domain-containing protein [Turneriella sp.]
MADDQVQAEEAETTGKPGEEAGGEGKPAFVFESFRDFLNFVSYVGEGVQVEFAEPVLDGTGTALVQKGVHMRPSLQKSLQQFYDRGNLNEKITIADTQALHTAIRERVVRSLTRCLEPGRFHMAQALTDISAINIRSMLVSIIQRRDVLPVFMRLDQSEDPLLPHLGEVALVAGGMAEQYCRNAGKNAGAREVIRTAIFAGLLHDIALAGDDDFLLKDIEKITESEHARKSAEQAKALIPALPVSVTDIIEHHHRMNNPYEPESDSTLEAQSIAAEALALSEYIFVQLRSQYKKDETMNSAELLFYELGRAFGQGKFHPQFRRIAARVWETLFATLHYGYEIGAVESQCPHKPSAIAYPTPRCTQVMCHRHVTGCEHYDTQFPLEILQATRFPGRPGALIEPGKYGKCRLATKLPKGINEKLSADAWLKQTSAAKSGEAGA